MAVAVVVTVVAGIAATPALAALGLSSGATQQISSALWAAAPNGSTSGAGYSTTWNLPTTPAQYFTIANTGTLALNSETYTAVNSKTTNGQVPPNVQIDACVGATWNTATGTCSGTVTKLVVSGAGATVATVSIGVGAALSVRATPTSQLNFPQSFMTTVSVSVDRASARAATTTNN